MTPPPIRRSGRGRGGRGERRPSGERSDQPKPKKNRERSGSKRGGRGGGPSAGPSGSCASSRPTRAVTTVLKKLVVRNIPPTATEEEARRLLEAHGVGSDFVWRFVPGRKRSNNREAMPARLYLDTKKEPEKARKLIAALHGQMFYQDTKEGDAKPLNVEFAPFQKIPREKQRKDAKVGTIDRDPEYMAFLEELAKPKDKLPSAEAAVDMTEGESVEKPVAALVKYLNERKMHSRDKGKGKTGKTLDKNGVRRLTRKKDASKQKGTKAKKTLKDRQKNSDAPGSMKIRKQRTGKKPSKKESMKATLTEPGSLRIMTPKSALDSSGFAPASAGKDNGAPQSTDLERKSEKRAPKGGKRNGSRGRAEKMAKEGGDGASGEGADVANSKPHQRRKGGNNGKKETAKKDVSKKEQGNRGDRKRKVFAPKDTSVQGTVAKS
ncbi:regulator of nonsense transcription [Phytophthora boehmeriae]|uniref:Regulator of nonsense transcription n=1 Tax=Phytophthora boehmeriae TaxID=109152 RepID=A0A8T1WRI7_9STRA|nr:regulator of nonsense transcription [Phytophthora boehmeriae]